MKRPRVIEYCERSVSVLGNTAAIILVVRKLEKSRRDQDKNLCKVFCRFYLLIFIVLRFDLRLLAKGFAIAGHFSAYMQFAMCIQQNIYF